MIQPHSKKILFETLPAFVLGMADFALLNPAFFPVNHRKRGGLGLYDRFENGFYNMRHSIFTSGPDLPKLMEDMEPMFSPKVFPGNKHPKAGKYSFSEEKRSEIFNLALDEIRKYSDCRVALCKKSENVWADVGLDLSRCSCVCQLD